MTNKICNIPHRLPSYLAASLGIALAGPAHGQFAPNVRAVDQTATGANDGTSWADAYVYLQDALAYADTHEEISELWVAAGTYNPDECDTCGPGGTPGGSDLRESTFNLINNVKVYGGFLGFEAELLQRDPENNVTVLSGDLLGNDGPDFANYDENSFHVVRAFNVDNTAWLNGFTITAGNATGSGPLQQTSGGGMFVTNGKPTWDGNPIVARCIFVENVGQSGGGMSITGDSNHPLIHPVIVNCAFVDNWAKHISGGRGGGLRNEKADTTLINCLFVDNTAENRGGGIYHIKGGGVTAFNCTVAANTANDPVDPGGCIALVSSGDLDLSNCIVRGNSPDQINGGATVPVTCFTSRRYVWRRR